MFSINNTDETPVLNGPRPHNTTVVLIYNSFFLISGTQPNTGRAAGSPPYDDPAHLTYYGAPPARGPLSSPRRISPGSIVRRRRFGFAVPVAGVTLRFIGQPRPRDGRWCVRSRTPRTRSIVGDIAGGCP